MAEQKPAPPGPNPPLTSRTQGQDPPGQLPLVSPVVVVPVGRGEGL